MTTTPPQCVAERGSWFRCPEVATHLVAYRMSCECFGDDNTDPYCEPHAAMMANRKGMRCLRCGQPFIVLEPVRLR
jgi:hypothetical protein